MPEPAVQYTFANITRGDPVASLAKRCPTLQNALDAQAGRYVVVCFYVAGDDPWGQAGLIALRDLSRRFKDDDVSFLAVSVKTKAEAEQSLCDDMANVVLVHDWNRMASRTFGVLPQEELDRRDPSPVRRYWMVVDPTQHVLNTFPFSPGAAEAEGLGALLSTLPPPARFSPMELPPPVLVLPHVFDEDLCRRLIEAYDQHGGRETGIVVNTEMVIDNTRKRRRDHTIQDQALIEDAHRCLAKRVAPEIERLFYMRITRVDRNIVACYAAEDDAHFLMPHRDNNAPTTAYRRFAVSINLNDGFEGGAVRFPEYNGRDYRAPPGWALVFPCAVLHQVTQVTRGRRYVFLPFIFE